MSFSLSVSFSSLPVFLPTVIRDMGFTAIKAQGLSAPPFLLSFVLTLSTTWLADRRQQRGLIIAFLSAIGAIGYVLLATCDSVAARYMGVFLAASGVFPAMANLLPWVLSMLTSLVPFFGSKAANDNFQNITDNQGSDTRRGVGVVILNFIGQCGPFVGTNVFPNSDAPRFIKGQSISAAFTAFACILALLLRALLVWENKILDRKYGSLEEQKEQRDRNGEQNSDLVFAEENYGPHFRYIL
jgi:retrograde regulation protein 2